MVAHVLGYLRVARVEVAAEAPFVGRPSYCLDTLPERRGFGTSPIMALEEKPMVPVQVSAAPADIVIAVCTSSFRAFIDSYYSEVAGVGVHRWAASRSDIIERLKVVQPLGGTEISLGFDVADTWLSSSDWWADRRYNDFGRTPSGLLRARADAQLISHRLNQVCEGHKYFVFQLMDATPQLLLGG